MIKLVVVLLVVGCSLNCCSWLYNTFMTAKKMTNFVTPHPLNPQKRTIDLLFKNKRIGRHEASFETPHVDFINV